MGGANPDINLKDGNTALTFAIRLGRLDLVQILLRARANINKPDSSGSTGLMWASHIGDLTIIKQLLKVKGISLKTKNRGGLSALGLAQANKNLAVIELLVRYGAT